MPIYDFKCHGCGCVFDKLIAHDDLGSVACPECGSAEVDRMISPFAATGSVSGGESSGGGCNHFS